MVSSAPVPSAIALESSRHTSRIAVITYRKPLRKQRFMLILLLNHDLLFQNILLLFLPGRLAIFAAYQEPAAISVLIRCGFLPRYETGLFSIPHRSYVADKSSAPVLSVRGHGV